MVRLARGDFDAVTAYGDDPVAVARRWADEGATRIHVVDLDAAREGSALQSATGAAIVDGAGVRCQVAGGIRGADQVAEALAAGADRVVLGSALIEPTGTRARLRRRTAASHRGCTGSAGRMGGWAMAGSPTHGCGMSCALAAARSRSAGLRCFAVTAIAGDGGLRRTGRRAARAGPSGRGATAAVIASGGVGRCLADIAALADAGYEAAIMGRALYEGAFSAARGARGGGRARAS